MEEIPDALGPALEIKLRITLLRLRNLLEQLGESLLREKQHHLVQELQHLVVDEVLVADLLVLQSFLHLEDHLLRLLIDLLYQILLVLLQATLLLVLRVELEVPQVLLLQQPDLDQVLHYEPVVCVVLLHLDLEIPQHLEK